LEFRPRLPPISVARVALQQKLTAEEGVPVQVFLKKFKGDFCSDIQGSYFYCSYLSPAKLINPSRRFGYSSNPKT
jgi:hypothetical protein